MRTRATAPLLLGILLAASALPVQAFPIARQDYAGEIPFAQGVEGMAQATFLSGSIQSNIVGSAGPFVFLNTTGFTISGVTQVCWAGDPPTDGGAPCLTSQALAIKVLSGGSAALQFPAAASGTLASSHSLAFFIDISETLDFDGVRIQLDRGMASTHVDGQAAFSRLPTMPATALEDIRPTVNSAGLLLLGAATKVQVTDGAGPPRTFSGDLASFAFQGTPSITPFGVGASLVPFAAGSTAHLEPAEPGAAEQGMDPGRLNVLFQSLQSAQGQGNTAPEGAAGGLGEGLEPIKPILGALLDGALLTLPLDSAAQPAPGAAPDLASFVGNLTLLRFDTLDAEAKQDGTVAMTGTGPLQIQSGRVIGAPSLVGIMPWWCWLLWVAALGMWIARLTVKPAKENERWDKLRWVGWVAGPVVGLIVFWLWDGQVHDVFGLSMLRGGGGGAGTMMSLLTVVVIGLLIYLAVVVPLSSLLKSGARFAKQGRFMGLHRPVAMVLGFLLGTTLLLSYVDLIIHMLG